MAVLLGFLAEEAVRDLKQDARAVARVLLQPHAAAVLEIDQDRQGIVDHLVRLLAAEVRECADAAGVVFKLRTIQAATLVACIDRFALHKRSPIYVRRAPNMLIGRHIGAPAKQADRPN